MHVLKDAVMDDEFIGAKLTKKGNIKLVISGREIDNDDLTVLKFKLYDKYATRFIRFLEHMLFGKVSKDINDRDEFQFNFNNNSHTLYLKTHSSIVDDRILVSAKHEKDGKYIVVSYALSKDIVKGVLDGLDKDATDLLHRKYRQ